MRALAGSLRLGGTTPGELMREFTSDGQWLERGRIRATTDDVKTSLGLRFWLTSDAIAHDRQVERVRHRTMRRSGDP